MNMDRIIDAANRVIAAANELCRVVRDAEAEADVPPKPVLNEPATQGAPRPSGYWVTRTQLLCLVDAAYLASQYAPFNDDSSRIVEAAGQAMKEIMGDA